MLKKVSVKPKKHAYLGDNSGDEKVVHIIEYEDPRCLIDKIIARGDAVLLTPDSLGQAHIQGFKDCSYCFARLKKRLAETGKN